MGLPQYTRLRAYEEDTDFANDQVESVLRELNRVPIINGVHLEDIELSAGDNYVPHKLERRLRGWVITRVKSIPTQLLSGTIASFGGGTTVTGSSTKFQSELTVGDRILLGTTSPEDMGVSRTVTTIASDTSLTVSVAYPAHAGDPDPKKLVPITIFDIQDDNDQKDKTLFLNSNTAVTVDIWVF